MADDAPTSTVVAADVPAAGAAAVQDAPAKDAVASPSADNTSRKGESVAAATAAATAAVAEKNKTGDAPTAAVGGDSAEAPSKSNGGVVSGSDKNVPDAGDAAAAAAAATGNDGASAATPATSTAKKAGKVSRRKSAVNPKKTPSKSNPADQRFKEGDQVLAKMRSFPPWPAVVLSRELLPGIMVGDSAQKGTTKSLDSVGPAAWVTQYPIFYLGTYE